MSTHLFNLTHYPFTRSLATVVCLAFASSAAAQDIPPSYGHNFLTIGAPGNRDASREERPIRFDTSDDQEIGGVAYEYRITRNEVSSSQWIEFARAYRPFMGATPEYEVEAGVLNWTGSEYQYLLPFYETRGAQPSFGFAARYCNWLHNDKVNESWAFESGAYDTSLFVQNPDGSYPVQSTRLPGARYWIPSFDETIKAFYFDPNRYGPGLEGYWPYVNMSLSVPIPGVTTNAGTDDFLRFGLGLFPSAQSPWGLLDTSGGVSEMTDSFVTGQVGNVFRRKVGSRYGSSLFDFEDKLDSALESFNQFSGAHGFRVGSVIPSPGIWVGIVPLLIVGRRSWRVAERPEHSEGIVLNVASMTSHIAPRFAAFFKAPP